MRFYLLFPLFVLLLFLSGCISINYHQKVAQDGSSVVRQETDVSALTNLRNSSSLFGSSLFNSSSSLKPENKEYNKAKYDAYQSAEEYGITLLIQPSGEVKIGSYSYVAITVSNNANRTLRDVQIGTDSNAFSQSNQYGNFLGTLKPDEYRSQSLYLSLLDVKPGNHPLTVIVTFKDEAGQGVKLAKTELIKVEARATPTPSITPDYDAQFEKQCEELRKSGSECSYSNGKSIASKRYENDGKFYSFEVVAGFPNTKYELEVFRLPATNASSSGENSMQEYDIYQRLDAAALKQSISYLKLAGAGITYSVEMPGKITKAEGGANSENVARFDVIEMIENGKTIKVTSEELNAPYVALAGIILLVMVFLAWKFVRKNPPTPIPSTATGSSYPPLQTNEIEGTA